MQNLRLPAEIKINNQGFKDELAAYLDKFMECYAAYDEDKTNLLHERSYTGDDPEGCVSGHALVDALKTADTHQGYPELHCASPITTLDKVSPGLFGWALHKTKYEMVQSVGAHSNALSNYYPPGGFVGWHTNWNASAYQILLTWSKTGDGYFRYWDQHNKKIITIRDVPGWHARHFYFGRKDEPEYHCWHAAYTNCPRYTLAFKFTNGRGVRDVEADARAQRALQLFVEDIQSD